MAKRLEYDIVTDPSKGIAGLKQFASAAKKSMKDVDDSLGGTTTNAKKVAAALSGLADELETEMKGAATAAKALGDALGPEIAGRANLDQVVGDLHKMGLTFDEITADADALAGSLKKLDSVQMSGIEQSTKRTKDNVDEVGKSADSSKSALANMIGNSVQDLGALGGVAGSAGVAIGQMGEFMADAKLQGEGLGSIVTSFATVAGPIAALSIGIELVTNAWNNYQETQKKIAERNKATVAALEEQLGLTDKLTKSYEDATDTFGLFVSTMDEDAIKKSNKALAALGLTVEDLDGVVKGFTVDKLKEATDLLSKAGVPKDLVPKIAEILSKYDDWKDIDFKLAQQLSTNGEKRARGYTAEIKAIAELIDQQENLINTDVAKQFLADAAAAGDAETAIVAHSIAVNTDADGQVDWKKAMVDAIPGLEEQRKKVDKLNKAIEENAAKLDAAKDALQGWGQRFESAFQGALGLQKTVDEMAGTFETMARREDTLSNIFHIGNAAVDAASQTRDIEDAINGLTDAAKDVDLSKTLDPTNLKADKLLDAFDSLRPQIQQKITDAFITGGPEAGQKTADAYVDQIFKVFKGRLSKEEIRRILGIDDLEVQLKVEPDLQSLTEAKALIDGLNQIDPLLALQLGVDLDSGAITPAAAKVVVDNALKNLGTAGLPVSMLPPDPTSLEAAQRTAHDFYVRNPGLMSTTATPPPDSDLARASAMAGNSLKNYPTPLTTTAAVPSDETLKGLSADAAEAWKRFPVTIPVRLDNKAFDFLFQDAGGTTPPSGGIAGERRPEIVNDRYLVVGPTYVPPGTRVTSGARTARILRSRGSRGLKRYDKGGIVPSAVTVNVNTAVIGSPFDVMNAVSDAVRRAQRLLPRNP